MQYDKNGRPVRVTTVGALIDSLNVTYDQQGHVTRWFWGDMSVANTFDDRSGNLMEHKLANKITFRYIYKTGNKVRGRNTFSGCRITTAPIGLFSYYYSFSLIISSFFQPTHITLFRYGSIVLPSI